MKSRRWAIVAVSALAAAGGGAAIAATGEDKARETEDAILDDAAESLGVETEELRGALSDAQLAQVDRAVEEGILSEEDAEAIKRRMEQVGLVLGFPGGPPHVIRGPHPLHGPLGPGPGGPDVFDAIADELGLSVEQLHEQLLSGKTMRQIARANGKTVADVKSAARAALEEQIEEGVQDERLTEEEAERLRDDLPDMVERLTRGPRFHRERHLLPVPPPPGFFGERR